MIDVISKLPWDSQVTVVGIFALLFLLIAFGWLVPRWYVKAIQKQLDFERATVKTLQETVQIQAKTSGELNEVSKTVEKIMGALQEGGSP